MEVYITLTYLILHFSTIHDVFRQKGMVITVK